MRKHKCKFRLIAAYQFGPKFYFFLCDSQTCERAWFVSKVNFWQ